jgi:hypothetical protein
MASTMRYGYNSGGYRQIFLFISVFEMFLAVKGIFLNNRSRELQTI